MCVTTICGEFFRADLAIFCLVPSATSTATTNVTAWQCESQRSCKPTYVLHYCMLLIGVRTLEFCRAVCLEPLPSFLVCAERPAFKDASGESGTYPQTAEATHTELASQHRKRQSKMSCDFAKAQNKNIEGLQDSVNMKISHKT